MKSLNLISVFVISLIILSGCSQQTPTVSLPEPFSFIIERDSITQKIAIYSPGQEKKFQFKAAQFKGDITMYGSHSSLDDLQRNLTLNLLSNSPISSRINFVYNQEKKAYQIFLNGEIWDFRYPGYAYFYPHVNINAWFITEKENEFGDKKYGLFLNSKEIFPCVYNKIQFFNVVNKQAGIILNDNEIYLIDSLLTPILVGKGTIVPDKEGERHTNGIVLKNSDGLHYVSRDTKFKVDFDKFADIMPLCDEDGRCNHLGLWPYFGFEKNGQIGIVDSDDNFSYFPLIKTGGKITLVIARPIHFGNDLLFYFKKDDREILVNQKGLYPFPEDDLLISSWKFVQWPKEKVLLWIQRDNGDLVNYDVNYEGHLIIIPKGSTYSITDRNVLWVKSSSSKWGCLSSNGDTIVPVQYEKLEWDLNNPKHGEKIFATKKNGEVSVYDLAGRLLITKE